MCNACNFAQLGIICIINVLHFIQFKLQNSDSNKILNTHEIEEMYLSCESHTQDTQFSNKYSSSKVLK